jgi:type I restriction enzyme R subunit
MAQTTENAFEAHVEEILLNEGGWQLGTNAEWNKDLALFPERILAFIAATQPKLWAQMEAQHGANLYAMLIKALVKELAIKGTLQILRHAVHRRRSFVL